MRTFEGQKMQEQIEPDGSENLVSINKDGGVAAKYSLPPFHLSSNSFENELMIGD